MFLTPTHQLTLIGDTYPTIFPIFYRQAQAIAVLANAQLTLLNKNFTVIAEQNLEPLFAAQDIERMFTAKGRFFLRGKALNADANLIAVVDTQKLLVLDVGNQGVLHEEAVPARYSSFEACYFSEDNKKLWVVLRHWCADRFWQDREAEQECKQAGTYLQLEVQMRSTHDWSVQRSTLLEDDGEAIVILNQHPEGEIIAIQCCAGQNGRWTFWAYDDGKNLHIREATSLSDINKNENGEPIIWHPSGSEFLILDFYHIRRFSFPECLELGRLMVEELPHDASSFGMSACYLSDERALISSDDNLLFVLDLPRMKIIEQVFIRGYESQPVSVVYPERYTSDNNRLYLQMNEFQPHFENSIISSHPNHLNEPGPHSPERLSCTFLNWGDHKLFGSLTPLNSTRPYTQRFMKQWGLNEEQLFSD